LCGQRIQHQQLYFLEQHRWRRPRRDRANIWHCGGGKV
jgi:hypothetical protein